MGGGGSKEKQVASNTFVIPKNATQQEAKQIMESKAKYEYDQ